MIDIYYWKMFTTFFEYKSNNFYKHDKKLYNSLNIISFIQMQTGSQLRILRATRYGVYLHEHSVPALIPRVHMGPFYKHFLKMIYIQNF